MTAEPASTNPSEFSWGAIGNVPDISSQQLIQVAPPVEVVYFMSDAQN